MGMIKKLTLCGLICLLSASIVGCNNTNSNTSKEVSKETSKEVSKEVSKEASKKTSKSNLKPEQVKDDTPIAKVGKHKVLKKALSTQLNYQKAYIKMSYGEDFLTTDDCKQYLDQIKNDLVESLINTEIAIIKAEELKLMPTAEEIKKAYEDQKASFGTQEQFNAALKESNMTEAALQEEVKTALITQNISTYLTKDVAVTEPEIKKYYEENIAQYTVGAGANLSHILVKTEEEAKKVKAEYDAGTSFKDLAAKYGTDGTASQGGALGYIEYDTQSYDADFMAGAKKLTEGQVSQPIKTQFGWHIIKAEGIQSKDVVTAFEEVKDQASAALLAQKQNEEINKQLEVWRNELGVEKYDDVIAIIE